MVGKIFGYGVIKGRGGCGRVGCGRPFRGCRGSTLPIPPSGPPARSSPPPSKSSPITARPSSERRPTELAKGQNQPSQQIQQHVVVADTLLLDYGKLLLLSDE